jgi:hypothetical protein
MILASVGQVRFKPRHAGGVALEMVAMAKKKPGPRPVDGGRVAATNIRSTVAWKEWLDRLADFDRSTVADVVDHALVAYARQVGFKEVAPKR